MRGRRGARPKPEPAESTVRSAPGSITLIDGSGLEWFMDTNMTSSSIPASGAMSEASYTTSVTASTSLGGTTDSTLNDAYDSQYNGMCVSLSGGTGPCSGGGGGASAPVRERQSGVAPLYIMYNQTGGPPVPDGACGNRQYVFPTKPAGGVLMQREGLCPVNRNSFARWLNIFTNTTGAPITFNVIIDGDDLGSDSSTRIVTSSNGNAAAEIGDTAGSPHFRITAVARPRTPGSGTSFRVPAPRSAWRVSFLPTATTLPSGTTR